MNAFSHNLREGRLKTNFPQEKCVPLVSRTFEPFGLVPGRLNTGYLVHIAGVTPFDTLEIGGYGMTSM